MTNGKTEKRLLASRGKHSTRNLCEEHLGVAPNNQDSFGTKNCRLFQQQPLNWSFIPFFILGQDIGYLKVMPAF